MIALKKMNGLEMVLNADLIESIESTPDTVITLTTGRKLMVKNSIEDIVGKTLKYKQLTHQTLQVVHRTPVDGAGLTATNGTARQER